MPSCMPERVPQDAESVPGPAGPAEPRGKAQGREKDLVSRASLPSPGLRHLQDLLIQADPVAVLLPPVALRVARVVKANLHQRSFHDRYRTPAAETDPQVPRLPHRQGLIESPQLLHQPAVGHGTAGPD